MAKKKGNEISFTKAALDALPIPEKGKRVSYWDKKKEGLIIRVSDTGSKVFYLYRWSNGKPVKLKIGPYPAMSIENARKKADELNGAIAMGEDPSEKRRHLREQMTLRELFDWYIENCAKPKGKKTWKQDVAQFNLYLQGLEDTKISRISKADVRELHTKVATNNGPYAANRLLALVRCIFNKAINHELLKGDNPAKGIERCPEKSRDRRLSAGEIPAFFQAVADEPNETIRDYIFLSLFSAARRSNVLSMRWEEIDFTEKSWRIPETKNGTSQIVPLGEREIEILERRREFIPGPWVFPGTGATGHLQDPKKSWKKILERAGIKDLRLHDLRRTLGSWMVDTGATLHVVGKALNHKSQQTTQIYARLSTDPIRSAKERAISAIFDASNPTPPSAP